MLSTLNLAREEDIERSIEIDKELEDLGITNERRTDLRIELERVTARVLRKINDEVLADLNNLEPLFKGNLIKKLNERYETEIENKEKIERWGWVVEIINGEKRMYDPNLDEEKREFKKIPMIKAERTRTIYLCSTNRAQVLKIKELLMNFWSKVKGEFKYISIDKILEEKKKVEGEIAAIDRNKMEEERLTEGEFLDSDFIKRPVRRQVDPADQKLFDKFSDVSRTFRF